MNFRETEIVIWLFFMLVIAETYPTKKYNCSYSSSDTECQNLFRRLVLDQKTKMVHININYQNVSDALLYALNNISENANPISSEFLWINKSSAHLLSLPDDFHYMTFGVLTEGIYQVDLHGFPEANSTNETLDFLFNHLMLNDTIGLICERNSQIHPLFELFVLRPETDFTCFSTAGGVGELISKTSLSFRMITVLCVVCILWFPMVFALTDQNKIHSKETQLHRYFQITTLKGGCLGSKEKDSKNEKELYRSSYIYDRGDVPYGPQRIFLSLIHKNVDQKHGMFIIHRNFTLLIIVLFSFPCLLMIPFHKGYMQVTYVPKKYFEITSILCILGSSIYFLILFGLAMPACCKHFTYCFDINAFMSCKNCISHIEFSDILEEISERNYFHNLINRQLIFFHWKLWYKVTLVSFTETRYKTCDICKKVILSIPICVAFLCNIIFQMMCTIPSFWYSLDLSFTVVSKLTSTICMTDNICVKLFKLILTIVLSPVILLTTFCFLSFKWSIIAIIPMLVKMLCYTLFFALPLMDSFDIDIILSYVILISYCIKHYTNLIGLYSELLKMMLRIHEGGKFKLDSNCVEIAEFEYLADNVFPFRVQCFYYVWKTIITVAIFLITVSQYFIYKESNIAIPFDKFISFVFIFLFPALACFVFNSSNEQMVTAIEKEVRTLVQKWYSESRNERSREDEDEKSTHENHREPFKSTSRDHHSNEGIDTNLHVSVALHEMEVFSA